MEVKEQTVERRHPDSDPQVFFDLARDRLATQLATLDAIDNKIGLLFTTSSALLGILAAIMALKVDGLGVVEYTAVSLSIGSYLIVAWFSEHAYRVQTWKSGPDLKHVYRFYKDGDKDERSMQWEIANHIRRDYDANKPEERRKSESLRTIQLWVITQSLILVAALVLVAAGA